MTAGEGAKGVADEPEIEIPDKLYFRIGEIAELVGVEPHVLRYWEQEFRIRPERSPSGQRMYKRRDIARFLRIRALVHKQGFTIAGARRALKLAAEGEDTPYEPDLDQLQAARRALAGLSDQLRRLREDVARAWEPHVGPPGRPDDAG